MKRRILIATLFLGTVAGFSSGFASLRQCRADRRAAFEERITELCARATERPAPRYAR